MILVKLMGGLGNQMFQYACAKQLAVIKDVPLKIDLSFLKNRGTDVLHTIREYELDIFNIKDGIANAEELNLFKRNLEDGRYILLHKYLPFIFPYYTIREKAFAYDQRLLKVHKNTYIDGFWQSYKYFSSEEQIIRQSFSFKKNPEGKNLEHIAAIAKNNSISLHVRRGDYVNDKNTNQYHGTCSLSYYQTAISIITSKIKNPHFFIFSDDMTWVKENIKPGFPHTYIDHNTGINSFEDLRLMSLCQHQIIANSSFSWWGAWLNNNPEKIVVAPDKWFADSSINTKDLYPQSWIRL